MQRLLSTNKRYIMISTAFTTLAFMLIFGVGKFMMLQSTSSLTTSVDYCSCPTCNRAEWNIPIYQQLGYSSPELCRVDVEKMATALREHSIEIWLWSFLPPSLRPSCETLNVCLIWTDREGYNEMAVGMLFAAMVLGNGVAIAASRKPRNLSSH